jgi:hypothetical protein
LRGRGKRLAVLYCPEAMGINVTATMQKLGITLPKTVTYQVALAGTRQKDH